MVQTVCVWAEDEDRSAAEKGLAAVADRLFKVSGDKILQPVSLPHILAIICGTEAAGYVWVDGRLVSPNLNGVGVENLRLHQGYAAVGPTKEGIYDFFDNPFPGVPGQEISAYSLEADETGVAHFNSIAVILGDRRHPYMPKPPITQMVPCTIGAATAITWTPLDIVLEDSLPAGLYRFHGADLCSTTAIAARITVLDNVTKPPAIIPRRLAADPVHPFNYNIGGNVPYMMNMITGGALPIGIEVLCESTDTALNLTLFLQKVQTGPMG